MRLYTLTSDLHGELAHNAHNEQFIKDIEEAIGETFDYRESDFSDYGAAGDIIYVRTGGTEGIFRQVFEGHEGARVRLLTSGQSNSLAASMEILSWLNQQGLDGEIIHGSVKEIANELLRYYPSSLRTTPSLVKKFSGRRMLAGKRYGVIGHPSDWLISSTVDYSKAKKVLGAELIDIPMEELIAEVSGPEGSVSPTRGHPWPRKWEGPAASAVGGMSEAKVGETEPSVPLHPLNAPKYGKSLTDKDMYGALQIYAALKRLVEKHRLDGLTLRCFDLLTAVRNTGCLALAMLNAEGIIAACEGDIPAMLSMAIMRTKYGRTGFQVNLSRIAGGNFLFAHCTVPLDMVSDYCYDTHFESGIGVAIHGILPVGPARIFKLGADLEHCIDERVNIIDNPYGDNLCRTQVVVRSWADRDKEVGKDALRGYMLAQPLGVRFDSPWWPAILIGLAGAGHQAWSANLFSTTGDMFPKSTVATITGIGAMAGGIGSMIIQWVAGQLFTYAEAQGAAFRFLGFEGKPAGYFIMFCFCGLAYLIAWSIMKSLVPKYKPVEI